MGLQKMQVNLSMKNENYIQIHIFKDNQEGLWKFKGIKYSTKMKTFKLTFNKMKIFEKLSVKL